MDKTAVSGITLSFEIKEAHGRFYPMLVAENEGRAVESVLHLNGFKHRKDCETFLQHTADILKPVYEDEGTET